MIRMITKSSKPKGKKNKQLRLPPGEMGLPWIGETMDFYKSQRNNRLFDHFVHPRIKKHGKIFKTRLMGSPTIVVNGAEANKFFLSNEFKLVVSSWPTSSVQLMGRNSIMEAKGDQHRTVRGLIATSVGYLSLEVLVPKMCRLVQISLAEHWGVNGGTTCSSICTPKEISLYYWTKTLTFKIVFECLLGIKVESGTLEMFEKVLEGVFAPPVGFPGSKFSRAKKAREEIERMLLDVVREKRKEVEERSAATTGANRRGKEEEGQLMWRLVKAMLHGDITEEEVVDNVVLLVFAAHDTTSFVVAMMFKMLAQHPDCYNLLLQEHMEIVKNNGNDFLSLEEVKKMKYTWEVARECMRLFPPIFGSFRKAVQDIEFDGFIIPKGWKVLWTAYGTHYSEEYFEDPMSFNPARFQQHNIIPPYVYVPFGGGPRVCAGSQLAKLSILVLVHYVVTGYDWSLVLPDEGITMDPLPFPSCGMPIRVTPKACGASNELT
ncbi:Taxadiene 5-alpha hydroxylase [Linum grandiflorum]